MCIYRFRDLERERERAREASLSKVSRGRCCGLSIRSHGPKNLSNDAAIFAAKRKHVEVP